MNELPTDEQMKDQHKPKVTLHDWFAGRAMQSLILSIASTPPSLTAPDKLHWCRRAYEWADAMMAVKKERAK